MKKIVAFSLYAPKLTAAVILAITAALGFYAQSYRIDSSMEMLLAEGDPDRAYYAEVERIFGSEEVTMVGVFADDVFARATLEKTDRLTRELEALEGVRQVVSLTTVQAVESDEDGLRIGKLVRQMPETAEESEALRARALANPLYLRNIVSPDSRAAGITVVYEPMSDREFEESQLEPRVREIVAAAGGPEQFAVTGVPTIKVHGARFMEDDIATFTPIAVALIIVVLYWAFRTVRGVMVPLATVLVGVVWTVGVMVLNGDSINMGTLVLPPLLITLGVAYSIHVVSQYYQEVQPGRTPAQIVSHAMDHVGMPVVVCAFTTMLGFAPFALSPITAIYDFGVYSIFGVMAIVVASFTLAPALLVLMPAPSKVPATLDQENWLTHLLVQQGRWAIGHRRLVFAGTLVACLFCLWGISRIEVVTDYLAFFHPQSEVRVDNAIIAERLAGTQPIYVVIDGEGPGSITRLPTLKAIKDLQDFLEKQPAVDTSMSLLDYLGLLRKALDAGPADSLPDTQEEVDQLFLFANPEDLKSVLNNDQSRANILLRTTLSGSTEVGAFVELVERFAADNFPAGVRVHPTGSVVLLNRTADTLAWGQIAGLWQVVVVLFVVLSVMFLSVRIGLLALIPNLVPIILLFGIMGWSGISLNISTSMIASLALGIAIDDTIHFLSTFNSESHRSGDQEAAVLYTMRTVGRPMVFTSVALAAGFLVVCLSNFQPVQHFGYLSSVTIGVALIVELFLSPALVTAVRIITLWDLLGLKIGPDPQKQIPLFHGLRPFQAKIVVLMARLAKATAGAFITRRGETKEELYVLLDGRADVYHSYPGPLIRSMGRGDVIGEMGLVRKRPRSADVVAGEEAEYLTLDGRFLKRIERRYPRIAATVFLNLARILSDRLESTTEALGEARKP
jgi:hypothetical protein